MTVSSIAVFLLFMWTIKNSVENLAQKYWEKTRPEPSIATKKGIVVGTTWINGDQAVAMMRGAQTSKLAPI